MRTHQRLHSQQLWHDYHRNDHRLISQVKTMRADGASPEEAGHPGEDFKDQSVKTRGVYHTGEMKRMRSNDTTGKMSFK